ncbi:MAG TPA: hypothetical protein VGN84_07850 [Solirubrobacterales bacterium]|nr:hypothetical protein [Solirubrobacterales bacterium]
MRLPRDISPGAAARRTLLADALIALGIALLAFVLAAGIGIVAFVALPIFLILLTWIVTEAAVRGTRRRSGRSRTTNLSSNN